MPVIDSKSGVIFFTSEPTAFFWTEAFTLEKAGGVVGGPPRRLGPGWGSSFIRIGPISSTCLLLHVMGEEGGKQEGNLAGSQT